MAEDNHSPIISRKENNDPQLSMVKYHPAHIRTSYPLNPMPQPLPSPQGTTNSSLLSHSIGQPPQQTYYNETPYAPNYVPTPPVPPKSPQKGFFSRKVALPVWLVILIVIALLGLGDLIGQSNASNNAQNASNTTAGTTQSGNTSQSTAAPTQAQKSQPTATKKQVPQSKQTATTATYPNFSDGTFVVGKDIQPGTYRTRVASPGCYFARLKGFSGSTDDIIANDDTDAPAIITIASTDKGFQSTGCGTWTKDLSAITSSKTSFGDGTFFVGTDIQPGTYKSSGQQGCYYARLSGFDGTTDDIIANDNTDTPAIVTIAPTDKGFQAKGCGTWTKM